MGPVHPGVGLHRVEGRDHRVHEERHAPGRTTPALPARKGATVSGASRGVEDDPVLKPEDAAERRRFERLAPPLEVRLADPPPEFGHRARHRADADRRPDRRLGAQPGRPRGGGALCADRNPIIELMAAEAAASSPRGFPWWSSAPRTGTPAPRRSTAPGSARRRSATCRWRCTTSWRMRSAAASTRLMPRRMPSCCHTPWATTRRPCRSFWPSSPRRSAPRRQGPPPLRRSGWPGLGLAEADLDRVAEVAAENTYNRPCPFGQGEIRALLRKAWKGSEPET